MTGDREFEERLRRELHDAADQIEPRRTLADLRRRILIWRLFHRRPKRLRKAARSRPDPETVLLTQLVPVAGPLVRHARPAADYPRCVCGRRTFTGWCCWTCMVADDGGWLLGPYDRAAAWTDVHTRACDLRQAERDPVWYAAPARIVGRR